MERQLIFQQTYYDSQPFTNADSYTFFKESEDDSNGISTMSEAQALEWLLTSIYYTNTFKEFFFENSRHVEYRFGVTGPFTTIGKKPGDIDLLLLDGNQPQLTVAFECKRVKIKSITDAPPKVNNASAIRKAVLQANHLQSMGFHKSYLLILLLDDSRRANYSNTMMRNTKGESITAVYDIPWNEPLHPDVGIVYVRITQPTGKSYNEMAGIGVCIDKTAQPLEQTNIMNNKIISFIQGVAK